MKSETKAQIAAKLSRAEARIAALTAKDGSVVNSPRTAEIAIREHVIISELEQEVMWSVLLNSRCNVLKIVTVGVGTLADVTVHPRDIFREAIRMNAHSLLLAHNHPSGDKTPSDSDLELTRGMVEAGKLIGIPVLDHLILTALDSYSFEEHGLM